MTGRARAVGVVVVGVFLGIVLGCGGGSDGASDDQSQVQPPPVASDTLTLEGRRVVPGRWRKVRSPSGAELTEEQRERIEQLQSIGYLSGSVAAGFQSGVTVHDPDRVHRGLNLLTSGHFPGAQLLDMEGTVLYAWEKRLIDVWPGTNLQPLIKLKDYWRRVHLFPDGDVLAIFEGVGIFRLDRESNLVWENKNGAHHDFEVLGDGRIAVLTRKAHVMPRLHPTEPILEDFVTVLDSEGRELSSVSVIEAMENSRFSDILAGGRLGSGDIFHTNTIHILEGNRSAKMPWLRAGNVLTTIRNIHAVVVVDLEARSVPKLWGGPFRRPHDPEFLPTGKILLFDNEGGADGKSRAVEFDPMRGRLGWLYAGTSVDTLFSATLGTVQRLANGNTLITESDNGRAIEVTPGKDVVWEYYNPYRVGPDREFIATLFEVVRLPADFPTDWIPER